MYTKRGMGEGIPFKHFFSEVSESLFFKLQTNTFTEIRLHEQIPAAQFLALGSGRCSSSGGYKGVALWKLWGLEC